MSDVAIQRPHSVLVLIKWIVHPKKITFTHLLVVPHLGDFSTYTVEVIRHKAGLVTIFFF